VVQIARSLERPARGVWLYVGVTLGLALVVALMPPTDWDGLFYHLTGPAWTLAVGRVGPPQANVPHLSFPGLMESLFTLAMALRGDVVAKLLHWSFALLLGGIVYRLANRHLGDGLGWGAVIALYATPMVAVLAGWAYNDLALAFFQVAALYAVLNGLDRSSPMSSAHDAQSAHDARSAHRDSERWFFVAGGLAGLSLGLKYTSFVCPVTLVALIVWNTVWQKYGGRVSRPALKRALNRAVGFSVVALIVASPWYLRNLAFTGNPVYPFLYRLWDGRGWSHWHADWYAQSGTGLGGDVGALLALPVTLTLGLRDMNYYDGRTGPLFLAALPGLVFVALLDRRKPRALTSMLWFGLAQYVVWAVGVVGSRSLFQSRLLLPALVSFCPGLAYVYDRLERFNLRGFSLRRLVGLVVTLVLSTNVVYQALDMVRLRPLPYLVGEESREAFLTRRLGGYYSAMRTVAELPTGARVQFLWEPRSYYSERVVQPDPILETWKYLCEQYDRDVDAIAAQLRERGVTHLLLHTAGKDWVARESPDHLSPGDLVVLEMFTAQYLDVVWELPDAYVLYAWR
jgi:4-amino-4-deoxy-L-arabinose transferase-like glycosyltransferase